MNLNSTPARSVLSLFAMVSLAFLSSCARVPARQSTSVATAVTDEELSTDNENKAPEATQLRTDGLLEYLHGNFPRAITLLETADALSTSAHASHSLYILYYCYLQTGDYRRALSIAETIANDQPFSAMAYEQVGLAELSLGNYSSAAEYFQKSLDFDEHPTRVHFYYGLAAERLGNQTQRDKSFATAEKEYQQILRKNPKDFSTNYELASLYLYWNKSVDQVPILLQNCHETYQQSSIEELPEDKKIYAHYYLPVLEGIYLYRKGAALESLNTLAGAISHMPDGVKADLAEIYFYLGQDQAVLGKKEQAKSFLEKALVMDPQGIYSASAKEAIRKTASLESTSP